MSSGEVRVKEAIAMTFYYYTNRVIDEVGLRAFYADLKDLNPEQVVQAYGDWRRDAGKKYFPKPAEIRAILSPEVSNEGKARDAAARLMGAVGRFGWNNASRAREYVGELGWEAMVRTFGSWESLCSELTAKQVPTLQAQIRELCLAILEQGEKKAGAPGLPPGVVPSRPQIEHQGSSGGFKSVGDLLNSMPIDAKKG